MFSAAPQSIGAGKRVAVVLSGCGVYDGSEIQEAVFTLARCSRQGARVECFAPDWDTYHVMNHCTGKEEGTKRVVGEADKAGDDNTRVITEFETSRRNIKVESARITRGNIRSLGELRSKDFDACIFPGGFGAVKNLSNWGLVNGHQEDFDVAPDVERVVADFVAENKALGFMCISPVIAAKCIPGVELTLGMPYGDKWPFSGKALETVRDFGAQQVQKGITDGCHIDVKHKVVSAPAYMYDAQLSEMHLVEDSVHALVDGVLTIC